jgi:site-specific recombinase XerD
VDGPHWSAKRAVALINVLPRVGLRVSEALALKVGDVELGPRSGKLLVREGKGLKSRTLALSSEARDTLKAYLQMCSQGRRRSAVSQSNSSRA